MSEAVILGLAGSSKARKRSTAVVDASTVSPTLSLRMEKNWRSEGPISGRAMHGIEGRSRRGTLTFMIGGDREVFERVKRYFEIWQKA